MATTQNLEFTLGETWELEVDCYDEGGNPLSLEGGGSVRFRLWNPQAKYLDFTSGGPNVEIIDTLNGKALITVNPSDQATAVLVPTVYSWDTEATLADGTISDQARGVITVRDSPPS